MHALLLSTHHVHISHISIPCCRPVTGEQEQVLRQLLDGVHKSFRSFVQQRRGDRIKVLVLRMETFVDACSLPINSLA